jgi:hypothetical protein
VNDTNTIHPGPVAADGAGRSNLENDASNDEDTGTANGTGNGAGNNAGNNAGDNAGDNVEATMSGGTHLFPRERRATGVALGRGLAVAIVAGALLPSGALAWSLWSPHAPTAALPGTQALMANRVEVHLQDLKDGVGLMAAQAASVAAALDEARARGAEADRHDRLRFLQRQVAKARDARRAAGQTGAALKGPFAVEELGDLGAIGLSETRWLLSRDGSVHAPVSIAARATLATPGNDEDAATVADVIDGTRVNLVRRCVAFEPYCLVDVAPIEPVSPAVIDTAPMLAHIAALEVAFGPSRSATPPSTAAASTSTPSATSTMLLVLMALTGLAVSVATASRLVRLSSDLTQSTWRLRSAWTGRATARRIGLAAELNALELAIDEVVASVEAQAAREDERHHQRARLDTAVMVLKAARERGGVPRLHDHDGDDPMTARVVLATNELMDALDGRAMRFKLGVDELDGTTRMLAPLAQRLLQVARLPGLTSTAVDELTSLGNAVSQRARRANALPALLDGLERLQPGGRDAISNAAALRSLPLADTIRLAVGNGGADATANAIAADSEQDNLQLA